MNHWTRLYSDRFPVIKFEPRDDSHWSVLVHNSYGKFDIGRIDSEPVLAVTKP